MRGTLKNARISLYCRYNLHKLEQNIDSIKQDVAEGIIMAQYGFQGAMLQVESLQVEGKKTPCQTHTCHFPRIG